MFGIPVLGGRDRRIPSLTGQPVLAMSQKLMCRAIEKDIQRRPLVSPCIHTYVWLQTCAYCFAHFCINMLPTSDAVSDSVLMYNFAILSLCTWLTLKHKILYNLALHCLSTHRSYFKLTHVWRFCFDYNPLKLRIQPCLELHAVFLSVLLWRLTSFFPE